MNVVLRVRTVTAATGSNSTAAGYHEGRMERSLNTARQSMRMKEEYWSTRALDQPNLLDSV